MTTSDLRLRFTEGFHRIHVCVFLEKYQHVTARWQQSASSRDSFLHTTAQTFSSFKFNIYFILRKGIIVKQMRFSFDFFFHLYKKLKAFNRTLLLFSSKLSASASAMMVTSGWFWRLLAGRFSVLGQILFRQWLLLSTHRKQKE